MKPQDATTEGLEDDAREEHLRADRARPLPGERVGRYELERLVGRGGMGWVFLARDRAGRPIALKMLDRVDAGATRRLRQEGRLLARLDHPCVVRALGQGLDAQGRPYLALEWIPGRDLGALLGRREAGRLSVAEATFVLERCALALAAIHARGVLHRDVKPGNLLLTPTGAVKLIDFGIAARDVDLGADEDLVGTPGYMCPEVWAGHPWTPAADVYGLGALACALLGGRDELKTRRSSRSTWTRLRVVRSPQDVPIPLPGWLEELLEELLACDPAARPAAADVARRLGRSHVNPRVLTRLLREASPAHGPRPPVLGAA